MRETHWRRSPCNDGACVEVGRLSYGHYAIRNSNFRADKALFTQEEMKAFITAVKNGHFDDMVWTSPL